MAIPDIASSALRVAVLSRSQRQTERLSGILEGNGLLVVTDELLRAQLQHGDLDRTVADVVLVNLDDADDLDDDVMTVVLEQVDLPILFNDSAAIRAGKSIAARAWGRRLAAKLVELAQDMGVSEEAVRRPDLQLVDAEVAATEPEAGTAIADALGSVLDIDDVAQELEQIHEALTQDLEVGISADNQAAEAVLEDILSLEHDVPVLRESLPSTAPGAERVWVLGASIGGPQALKEFLSELPLGLPMGFVLAQHIGNGFVSLLADQLNRVTGLEVLGAQDGMVPGLGQVLVAPVEQQLTFDEDGCIRLNPVTRRNVYSPSIDDVMTQVAEQYGANSGAIVFSGMGSDGLVGSRAIAERGGVVWAQDADTCVISSMADSVRVAGLANITAPPAQLARLLLDLVERGC
jgi:chemosensory pili system protein ChpB (putative protein-glutamate methylesterase)